MFCTNCGAKIEDDASFCPECGTKVEGNQPEKTVPEKRTAKLSAPKGSKNGKLIAGVGALVIAGAAIVGTMIYNQPEKVVRRAFSNTWEAIQEEESGLAAYLGAGQLKEALKNGKTSHTLSVPLDEEELFGEPSASDTRVVFQLGTNKDEELALKASLESEGEDFLAGLLSLNQEEIAAACPQLYPSSFYVNYEQLKEELPDLLKTYLGVSTGNLETEELEPDFMWEQLKAATEESRTRLLDNMVVEKTGKEKKAKVYQVTLLEEDLKELIRDAGEEAVDLASPYLKMSGASMVKGALSAAVDRAADSIDDDLVVDVHVGSKNRIVKLEGEYRLVILGSRIEGDYAIDMQGEKNLLDDMVVRLTCGMSGGFSGNEEMEVELSRKLTEDKDKLEDCIEIAFPMSSSFEERISVIGHLDKKSGDWNVESEWTEINTRNELSVAWRLDGQLIDVNKGKSFTVELGEIGFRGEFEDDYMSNNLLSGTRYTFQAGDSVDTSMIFDSVEKVNVLDLTPADLEEIAEEMEDAWEQVGEEAYKKIFGKEWQA